MNKKLSEISDQFIRLYPVLRNSVKIGCPILSTSCSFISEYTNLTVKPNSVNRHCTVWTLTPSSLPMSTILKAAPGEIQFVLLELDTFVSLSLQGIFFEEEDTQQVVQCL